MICIVDYDAGNLTSVRRALEHLGVASRMVSTGQELRSACVSGDERIVFPGVGHARAAMDTLRKRGLDRALRQAFREGVPVLGICLGAQIVLSHSEEGDTPCLNLISGECRHLDPRDESLKVPHMGWNGIRVTQPHPVLEGVEEGHEFYFVHSYAPFPDHAAHVFATCEYGSVFPAVVGQDNVIATQFHPEKSGRMGLRILENFCRWDGAARRASGGQRTD